MMICAFCSIVEGASAAHIVYDDDDCVAFLDRTPVFHGHVLVVPRSHVETLVDLPLALIEPLFGVARMIAAALPVALEAHGTFVAINNVVSQSVAHLHVHVVPRRRKDGLRGFFWPRQRYESDAQMAETAATIRAFVTPRSA